MTKNSLAHASSLPPSNHRSPSRSTFPSRSLSQDCEALNQAATPYGDRNYPSVKGVAVGLAAVATSVILNATSAAAVAAPAPAASASPPPLALNAAAAPRRSVSAARLQQRTVVDPREMKSSSSSGVDAEVAKFEVDGDNTFKSDNTYKFNAAAAPDESATGGGSVAVGGGDSDGGGGDSAAGEAVTQPSTGEQLGQAIQALVKPLLSEFGAAVLGFGAGSVFVGFFMGWQQSNRGKKNKRTSSRQALADLSMLDEAEIQELIGKDEGSFVFLFLLFASEHGAVMPSYAGGVNGDVPNANARPYPRESFRRGWRFATWSVPVG